MAQAIHHPASPLRALLAQAIAHRDPLHRRDTPAATSLAQPGAAASFPVSLDAARRAHRHQRNNMLRITNALGLFAALYAAVVLMHFAS